MTRIGGSKPLIPPVDPVHRPVGADRVDREPVKGGPIHDDPGDDDGDGDDDDGGGGAEVPIGCLFAGFVLLLIVLRMLGCE